MRIVLMVETDRRCGCVGRYPARQLRGRSKDPDAYVISGTRSQAEPYGIMLRRDDPTFKKVADGARRALPERDGQKLYDKWFMQKIPPKGLNLNAPISAER